MSDTIGSVDQSIQLDRDSSTPLFAQLATLLTHRIAHGEIANGVRLPSVRTMADRLGVNRATVQRAYRELEQSGLVASRVGSGTVVIGHATVEPPSVAIDDGSGARQAPFSRGILELARAAQTTAEESVDDAIDFAKLLPDVAQFPRSRLTEAVSAALERGDEVLQYGSPAGLGSLRRAVASRLRAQGADVEPEDVLIVNGIQQALDLLAKVMLEPGDPVVVESPTYANVLPLLRLYSAATTTIPLDRDGIDLVRLEQSLVADRPRFLYTMPSFHNPTAVTMPLARRRALLDLCARHRCLVVEDGCEQDLYYDEEPQPPLVALDRAAGVAHLGTFSKGLFPGLRLGYIVARGELRDMLVLAKRFTDYHVDHLAQAVLVEILERGDYDRHLDHLRREYGARMALTVRVLGEQMPSSVRFASPLGGFKTWLELPNGLRATDVAAEARRRGVLILPGVPFYTGSESGEGAVRLSISRTDPERIEEGITVLGEVLHDAIERRGSARRGAQHERDEAPPLI